MAARQPGRFGISLSQTLIYTSRYIETVPFSYSDRRDVFLSFPGINGPVFSYINIGKENTGSEDALI